MVLFFSSPPAIFRLDDRDDDVDDDDVDDDDVDVDDDGCKATVDMDQAREWQQLLGSVARINIFFFKSEKVEKRFLCFFKVSMLCS